MEEADAACSLARFKARGAQPMRVPLARRSLSGHFRLSIRGLGKHGQKHMNAPMERRIVQIEGRRVAYRRAGEGPTVVLFHQSPKSGADCTALMHRLAERGVTALAPDMAGNGFSEPLNKPVEAVRIADLAAASMAFLDALGVERAAVYGYHTGAGIALECARRYPQRCSGAVLHGLAVLTEVERADFLRHYLPALTPSWDGAHLAWTWARLREQSIVFPWYRVEPAARLPIPAHGPQQIMENALDLLRVGDAYRGPYGAAFHYERGEALERVAVPTTVMAARTDPLFAHLDRLGPVSEAVAIERPESQAAALDRAADLLVVAAHSGASAPAAPSATLHLEGDDLITLGGQSVRVQARGKGAPILCLPEPGGSSVTAMAMLSDAEGRRLLSFDPWGHGETDPPASDDALSVAGTAELGEAVLDAYGIERSDVVAEPLAAPAALALKERAPERIGHVVLIHPPCLNPAEREESLKHWFLPWQPDSHGGFALALWRALREACFFWPWYRAEPEAMVHLEHLADVDRLDTAFVERLKAGAFAVQAAVHALKDDRLQNLKADPHVTLAGLGDHPLWLRLEDGCVKRLNLVRDPTGWAQAITAALARERRIL
jgi:pimeloyl-ACP methyl ester carboxylesterase